MKRSLHVTFLLLALGAATGCAHVEPWERGVLAKPQMALDTMSLQGALRSHVYNSREAAAGVNASGGGGGCGCY